MLEPLVEAESLLTLVTIFAGGFLPPLLLSILILEAAMRKDAAEIVVFSSLAIAASAGAILGGEDGSRGDERPLPPPCRNAGGVATPRPPARRP